MRTPINRHRLPQLAADLAIILAAWFLAFRLRFDTDQPVYYDYYLSWQILALVAAIKAAAPAPPRAAEPEAARREPAKAATSSRNTKRKAAAR